MRVEKLQADGITMCPTAPGAARGSVSNLYLEEFRHLRHLRRFHTCPIGGKVDDQTVYNRRAESTEIQLATLENTTARFHAMVCGFQRI